MRNFLYSKRQNLSGKMLIPLILLVGLVTKFGRLFLGISMFLAIAINFSNVVGRYFFGFSIGWAEEVLSYLLIWSVFLGSVLVTLDNKHLRVSFLEAHLPEWARKMLEVVMLLSMAALSMYVAMQSHTVVQLMISMGQRSNASEIPMAWVHSAVYVGFIMIAAVAILRLIAQLLDISLDSNKRESKP